MSIHSSVNMVNFAGYDEKPEWMKSERYDYCEPFYDADNSIYEKKEHTGLFEKFVSLFR